MSSIEERSGSGRSVTEMSMNVHSFAARQGGHVTREQLLAVGMPRRVDAYFPQQQLIVEVDGWKSHRTRERFVGDRRQDFDILLKTGIPTVRLPSEDVTDTVIADLCQLLEKTRAAQHPPIKSHTRDRNP